MLGGGGGTALRVVGAGAPGFVVGCIVKDKCGSLGVARDDRVLREGSAFPGLKIETWGTHFSWWDAS